MRWFDVINAVYPAEHLATRGAPDHIPIQLHPLQLNGTFEEGEGFATQAEPLHVSVIYKMTEALGDPVTLWSSAKGFRSVEGNWIKSLDWIQMSPEERKSALGILGKSSVKANGVASSELRRLLEQKMHSLVLRVPSRRDALLRKMIALNKEFIACEKILRQDSNA